MENQEIKIIDNEIVTTTKIDLATFLAQKKEYLEQLEIGKITQEIEEN